MDWNLLLKGIGIQVAAAAAAIIAKEMARVASESSQDQSKTGEQPGADSAKLNP